MTSSALFTNLRLASPTRYYYQVSTSSDLNTGVMALGHFDTPPPLRSLSVGKKSGPNWINVVDSCRDFYKVSL